MRQVLINGRIFDGEKLLENHALVLEGASIAGIVARDAAPHEADAIIDLEGALLAPGLVDIQVNGGGGTLFNDDPSVEGLQQIAKAHRRFGTTAFLPTLITDDVEVMQRAIAAVDVAMQEGVPGIAGIHLEGPHLNPAYRGVHDAKKMRPLDDDALALLASLDHGRTLVTLAPETVPAGTIERLREAGVVVFGGHSAATYEQARAALDAGLKGFTHLFNAMSPCKSRAPGMVGAALEDAHSCCGIIADGYHVHPATLRLAVRCKAAGKAVLVTDAMPSVGARDQTFELYGETIHAAGGRCLTADGTLAGSDIGLIEAVRNMSRFGGVDRYEALRMASRYPATAIGIAGTHGSLRAGYRADLVQLDDDLNVMRNWIAGECVEYG